MFKKDKGSTLLAVLIFAFVLMVVISALAYNFRMDSLSIDSLVREKQNSNVSEGYFGNIVGSTDLSVDDEKNIGNFKFVTQPNSISPGFEYEDTNAELYNADPFLISHSIVHEFYDGDILRYIRNFIYNTMPNSTMVGYDDGFIPLNVPFVNVDAMSGNLATYRLDSNGEILDTQRGYIGYLDIRNLSDDDKGHGNDDDGYDEDNPGQGNGNNSAIVFSFNLVVGGASTRIYLPADITEGYKLSIGWNLVAGRWSIFLAVYDGNRVYTSSTVLSNLFDNMSQAEIDISNWQPVIDLPSGSTYASYPFYVAGTNYKKDEIVSANGSLYSCKVTGWCSSTASSYYAPGTGSDWESAWDLYNESAGATQTNDENGSDYPEYSAGTSYKKNDVVVSDNTLYSCKIPGWCSSTASSYYAPGTGSDWGSAWEIIGTVDENDEDGDETENGGSEVSDTGSTILVKWYHDVVDEAPKPLILRKMPRSGNYDLDIYRTTVDSVTHAYTAILADSFTTGTIDFDETQVHIAVPDGLFVLDAGMPLIFQGKNIFDFGVEGSYELGDGSASTKATLTKEPADTPLVIKKNATQFYIVYFNGNTLYTYLYSLTGSPSLVVSRIFLGENIEKIIAKFGVLFIITDSAVYMEDISNNTILSRVAPATGTATNYQILRDGAGKIYAMPEGLSCLADSGCGSITRLYFDTGCSSYNSCDAVSDLNNVSPYLYTVYKSFES
ncbi:membrane protein [Candidatus Francisella endociliophora]|uniref:Membrane protein n=1 Tax=Candidatus Francisella endociliophora TaxID=653937 RepID=A0A097EQR2_9GAMM|nr:membrane protein [Francisella sp. FSC1006]AIT09886.1 membrane protein [Francisella sp. FSC1006]